MSSPFLHPRQQKPQGTEWAARLIPGAASASLRKKPPRAAGGYAAFSPPGASRFANSGAKGSASVISVRAPGRSQSGVSRNWARWPLSWATSVLCLGASLAWRWWRREGNQRGTRAGRGIRNVLIVGAGGLGRRIASSLETHPEMERTVCGFLDDRKPLGNGVVGRSSDLAHLARTGFVDEVILAVPHDRNLTLRMLRTAQLLRLDVKMAPDLFGCEPTREPERIGGIPLISLHEEQLPVTGLLLKRALDVVVAGTVLTVIAPALTLMAILIRLDSPGPALYSAPRAGRKGRPFYCYKFRTMVRNADALKDGLREQNQ
ncbi:MAG: sugar transferase, partial [Candidatus Sulfotelmatobacter sp.]